MHSNLEDVKSVYLKASGTSVGDEELLVNHRCRFRGLYTTSYVTTNINDDVIMELLDGSGGASVVKFNVTIPPTVWLIRQPTVSLMVPDSSYVQFENGIYLKSVDDADGLNSISYTVFYT